jgi:hypothetical protein
VLTLVHGDDPVAVAAALDARAAGSDRIDAGDTTPEELMSAASTLPMFGGTDLCITHAEHVAAATVAALAAAPRDVILVAEKAPAALRRAVGAAGGGIEAYDRPKDAAATLRAAGARFGVVIDASAARSVDRLCGNDVSLITSIVRAAAICGIRRLRERHLVALAGDGAQNAAVWDVVDAVSEGDTVGALGALAACSSDPHAVVGALRARVGAALLGPDATGRAQRLSASRSPEAVAAAYDAVVAAERRLRTQGRPAAAAIAVSDAASALAPRPRT